LGHGTIHTQAITATDVRTRVIGAQVKVLL
jgi:hypothetical protein